KKHKSAEDYNAEDPGADDGESSGYHRPAPRPLAAREPGFAGEMVVETAGLRRKKWRFAASLSGGVARSGGEVASLLAAGARLDVPVARRLWMGLDTALWLLDGDTVRGQALASAAVLGIRRWLELGVGAGLTFGELGAGPATGLSLRFHLPPKPRA